MRCHIRNYLAVLILLILAVPLLAQSEATGKKVTLEDMKTWRYSSVSLSGDGQWYTVLYSLLEKPADGAEAKKENGADEENNGTDDTPEEKSLYGENAKTDVLYIRNSSSETAYEIPDGSRPLFSPDSEWIAYSIKNNEKAQEDEETINFIELRHLASGETRRWKSNASFSFTENQPYFVSKDKTDLLLVNLETRKEHYIGNIGEHVLHKDSPFLLYSIASADRRGNGIYLYDLQSRVTYSLDSGNCFYSRLAWNQDQSAVSAVKYNKDKGDNPIDIRLITIQDIQSSSPVINEYASEDIDGIPEGMRLEHEATTGNGNPAWSEDNSRLFVRLKKEEPAPDDASGKKSKNEESSVDVWHWKDKKLVSQQMMEAEKEAAKTYHAIFIPADKTLIPVTGPGMQTLYWAPDTDDWAIGADNRAYISDWDIPKRDLYRINLKTGERTPIVEEYAGQVHIAPGGERAILWLDGHYWVYEFATASLSNISQQAGVSFRDAEYDKFGADPDYGFTGWVKGQQSVIVNHKLDLWRLFLDGETPAVNLTADFRGDRPIRFRFDDSRFSTKAEPEERCIDLTKPHILKVFDIRSKESGYCQLSGSDLRFLIYKPAWFFNSRWSFFANVNKAKNSGTLIFRMGNNREYPEYFISNDQFENPRQITSTNPHESTYKWGRRILIEYENDDGVPLQGILTIPDSYQEGQTLPMIVYSYEKLSHNFFSYPSMSIGGARVAEMMYVSDGYLFLQPDIHFNVGTPHTDMHECIDAAIAEVIRLGYVDEKRIGYEGFSFGGHCGMFIATQDNRFAAIAAGAGVSNLVQGFTLDIVRDGSNEQDYYITQQGRLAESPIDNLDMYIRESAVFQAENMNTPLLLFHGTTDMVVRWEHSFGLYSILRFLKKPVIFLSYKGEGHGLRTLANRLDMHTKLKEFFDHHLKGVEAPDWIENGVSYELKADKEKKKDNPTKEMWK